MSMKQKFKKIKNNRYNEAKIIFGNSKNNITEIARTISLLETIPNYKDSSDLVLEYKKLVEKNKTRKRIL